MQQLSPPPDPPPDQIAQLLSARATPKSPEQANDLESVTASSVLVPEPKNDDGSDSAVSSNESHENSREAIGLEAGPKSESTGDVENVTEPIPTQKPTEEGDVTPAVEVEPLVPSDEADMRPPVAESGDEKSVVADSKESVVADSKESVADTKESDAILVEREESFAFVDRVASVGENDSDEEATSQKIEGIFFWKKICVLASGNDVAVVSAKAQPKAAAAGGSGRGGKRKKGGRR